MYHLLLTFSSPAPARPAVWRWGSLSSQGRLHLTMTPPPTPTPVSLNILWKQNMFRTEQQSCHHYWTGGIQLFIFICNSPAINGVWRSLIKYIHMIYSVTRTIMHFNTWSVVPAYKHSAYSHMYIIIHLMALVMLMIKKEKSKFSLGKV